MKHCIIAAVIVFAGFLTSFRHASATSVTYDFDSGTIAPVAPFTNSTSFNYTKNGLLAAFTAQTNHMNVNTSASTSGFRYHAL